MVFRPWTHVAGLLVAVFVVAGPGVSHAWSQQGLIDLLSPSDAETTPVAPSPTEEAADRIKAKREGLADRIQVAQRDLEEAPVDKLAAPENGSVREVDLLKQIDLVYSQQQTVADQLAELESTKEDLAKRIESMRRTGPKAKPPYSFLRLDELRTSQLLEEERLITSTAGTESAQQSLAMAKENLNRAESKRRQAKEKLEGNKDAAKEALLADAKKISELEAQLAKQSVVLAEAELTTAKTAEQVAAQRKELTEAEIRWVAQDATFSQSDLNTKILEIEKQEADLHNSLETAETLLPFLQSQWSQSRARLEPSATRTGAMVAETEARQLDHQSQQIRVALLKQQLERLAKQREIWGRRFRVHQGKEKRGVLLQWEEEAELAIAELDRKRQLEELQLGEARSAIGEIDKQLQSDDGRTEVETNWIKALREARRKQIIDRGQNLISIEATRRLHEQLRDEIHEKTEIFSLGDTLDAAWASIVTVWNYEITVTDDNSITVGKIIGVVLLLTLAVWVCRWLSRWFGRRVLPRMGVNDSAAAALQTIAFYLLVTISVLTVMRFVNVPLTVFTVLGGALAIGVGFGSQNVVNNFISGLILLAERPIRVGDMIQLESLFGTIEAIGARSTRVKTGENFEIIVPNSSFLENQVVNWTLTDTQIRSCVKIGVAYGSPTREVARWLRKAADEHGQVLDRPEPFIWFTDFGDNSLMFELHVWISMRSMGEKRRIESDLRFMIDQYFREAGLVIAFPQRDVHLDTARPLEIRMLPPGATEPEAASAPEPPAGTTNN